MDTELERGAPGEQPPAPASEEPAPSPGAEEVRQPPDGQQPPVPGDELQKMMQQQVNEALRLHDTAIRQEMQRQAVLEQGERMLREQMAEIAKLDPAVQQLADLRAMPEFAEFDRLVRAGADLVSAYKAATYGRAQQGAAAAAKQAAINAVKGTGHLAPVGGTAHPEGSLSDEEMELWKRYGFSRAEAQKYHKRFSQ